jgi:hypothetical protein
MDWLSDICKGLAGAVFEQFGRGIVYVRTIQLDPPSGEALTARVLVKFATPAQADLRQREKEPVTISHVFAGDPASVTGAYVIAGDPGTTVSVAGTMGVGMSA